MKSMKIAVVLLALVLVTSCIVGATFAKYTSVGQGSDSVTVAKWTFNVGSTDITAVDEAAFTFNLFDTIVDTVDGNTDAEVAEGVIAPGTKGSFDLVLTNASQVDAQYALDYTVTNTAGLPIEFCVDGTTWTSDLADVAASAATQLDYQGGTTNTKTITVQWRWAFETGANDDAKAANNILDTADGVATPTLTVAVQVTATQVD